MDLALPSGTRDGGPVSRDPPFPPRSAQARRIRHETSFRSRGTDLPNLEVPESGTYTVEHLVARTTLGKGTAFTLLGGDGTALLVHRGPDDYETDPAGDAGERIACGVVAEDAGER
jgi:Cu/Zn superoxide dismutase